MDRIARAISTAQTFAGSLRGLPTVPQAILADNVSLVLHEHSQSATVRETVRGIQQFNRREFELRALPVVNLHDPLLAADVWLCPTVGLSERLFELAERQAKPPRLIRIDEPSENFSSTTRFFRADACLALPELQSCSVITIALPVRPGRNDSELVFDGPYSWPEQSDPIMQSLESLVLWYIEQWTPSIRLWAGPAEEVLPVHEIKRRTEPQ